MVTPERFELPTCGLGNHRSIHLSYGATLCDCIGILRVLHRLTVWGLVTRRWMRKHSFLNRQLFLLAIDIGYSKRPERNEIDSGHEFSEERRGKLPVPAEE